MSDSNDERTANLERALERAFDRGAHPAAWAAICLSERIVTLESLTQAEHPRERPRDTFADLCELAIKACGDDVHRFLADGRSEESESALLQNPAAAPLLAFFIQSLARYCGELQKLEARKQWERKVASEPASTSRGSNRIIEINTQDVRKALANAFLINGRTGTPGVLEADEMKICLAFAGARDGAEANRLDLAQLIDKGKKAAFRAHYERDWMPGDGDKNNMQTIETVLRAHGYI